MDVVDSLRPDSIHGEINDPATETPHQDPQRSCTRNSPCIQQGCMICITPINHVRNLDVTLNGSNASPITHIHNLDVALNGSNSSLTSPTIVNDPQPTTDHPVLLFTAAFQLAIQENNIVELTTIYHLYHQTLLSYWDFICCDHSKLCAIRKTATNILNSTIGPATWSATMYYP